MIMMSEWLFVLVRTQKPTKSRRTRRPRRTNRTVEIKNCDDDDNVRAEDDQTLTGKIVVKSCPCESRFKKNATRLRKLSDAVCKQVRAYFQKVYSTQMNYDCRVRVLSGNKTHTVFSYTLKAPKSDHARAKAALKAACKHEDVSDFIAEVVETVCGHMQHLHREMGMKSLAAHPAARYMSS